MTAQEENQNNIGKIRGVNFEPEYSALRSDQNISRLQFRETLLDRAPLLKSKSVSIKAEFRPGESRAGREISEVSYDAEDIVEIEFVDGYRLWMNAEEYKEKYVKTVSRSKDADTHFVPAEFDLIPQGMKSRGKFVKWTVAAFRIFGVDLPKGAAKAIGEKLDDSHNIGLQKCIMNTGSIRLIPLNESDIDNLPLGQAYLLLIHGTFSNTKGCFHDLCSEARSEELAALKRYYGDRILAFDHGTVTKSPVENALDLVKQLPEGIKLHVVSHSRGGLIGELLCRGNRTLRGKSKSDKDADETGKDMPKPFSAAELRLFEKGQWNAHLAPLEELQAALIDKSVAVERFIRIACPVRGTTLASGRLDRWFSVLTSIAERLGKSSPFMEVFSEFLDLVAAVIKERCKPSALPGIAAQMPDSPFIKLVNWPDTKRSGDLTVISGDIEPDAWWAKLLVFVTDRFYKSDHDLVVNTPSMFGGAERTGISQTGRNQGPSVNHFNYFKNNQSAGQLVRALTSKSQEGFTELEKPVEGIAREALSQTTDSSKPIVFLLPGMMGSELWAGKERVWADIPNLIFGGFEKLSIDAPNIVPTQLMAHSYGRFIKYLSKKYQVISFPFDWRLPVEKEADRLADKLEAELKNVKQSGQAIRIVAHGMGGLVAQTMISRKPVLWQNICKDHHGRLIMLGTPNGGSYSIVELLLGRGPILRRLGLLDMEHSPKELLEMLSRFPGLLAMLPNESQDDFFSEAVWREYHENLAAGDTKDFCIPKSDDLKQAAEVRRQLLLTPVDANHTIYIAGTADITIAGLNFDPEKKTIDFLGTSRGDGRVTWNSGIPPDVPTYFMDAEHGDMLADESGFEAIADLLEQGATTRLPQTAPLSRAADELFIIPTSVEDYYPTEVSLVNAALGGRSPFRHVYGGHKKPFRVKMIHGNLAFAKYPVAVGHYIGDTIVSAEKYLDEKMQGALTTKALLGLYPGDIETNTFIINNRLYKKRDTKPQGALIVGLGTPINLTASLLARSFSQAMLEYVSAWTACRSVLDELSDDEKDNIGLTTLLIGTGAGGVSLSDSLDAILKGVVSANQALETANRKERISNIEIIELWKDTALQAAKCLNRLQHQPQFKNEFRFDGELHSRDSGLHRISYEEAPDWWQRFQVLSGNKDGGDQGVLRFTNASQRARNEVRLLPTQRSLVDEFIKKAISTTSNDQSVSRTLFDLLLPNALKEQALNQDDTVFQVDETSARYPWEILEDSMGNDGPFAIRHGLIRQLASIKFRESVKNTTADTAFVLGDPVSEFVELPGAQSEARTVARMLERNGHFSVTTFNRRPKSSEVVKALFERTYKILHLAGHGVYNHPPDNAKKCRLCGQSLKGLQCPEHGANTIHHTGMVLGDGVYLTPLEVRQMREVPELVFINCCHLGRIEADSHDNREKNNVHNEYHFIAANLATEFIRMGVRAVVAAGWAVDDAAAETFAQTFYDEMLSGKCFGDAITQSRKIVHNRHPQVNTWGAYQCYGEPSYCLIGRGNNKTGRKKAQFVSMDEVICDINNIHADLSTQADEDVSPKLGQLSDLMKVLKKRKWLTYGNVNIALARAYAEAHCFEEAIKHYGIAESEKDTNLTIKNIEEYANCLGRHAVDVWKAQTPVSAGDAPVLAESGDGESRTPEAYIKKAIKLVEWLNMAGNTSERFSLLGSSYKRLAWISEDPAGALEKMLQAYNKAYDVSHEKNSPDPYPLLNIRFSELVCSWVKPSSSSKDKVPGQFQIDETEDLIAKKAPGIKFWDEAMSVDFELLKALASEELAPEKVREISERYTAVRRLGGPREFASVTDQLEFIETMAESAGRHDVVKPLNDLRVLLR